MPESNYSDAIGFDQSRMTVNTNSGRPSSALDYHTHTARWGHRPKSTPVTTYTQGSSSGQSSTKINRPKTAAVILGRTDCNRVQQLEQEPTRRHNLENHLPMKRNKPPPWQKTIDPAPVPYVVSPGYILSRSKTKCHVTIRDEFFEPFVDENNKKKSQGDPERDNLIAQLQQQISDLSLYLEEERLNHKQTKQKAEEFLKDRIDQLTSHHQDHVRELEEDHKERMLKQKQQLEDHHKEARTTLEKQISRMTKEIEFLQGAFESYKSTLHTETANKWTAREEELKTKLTEEKHQALQELKTRMTTEKKHELSSIKKENHRNMETLRKDNKKEIDNLIRRFSKAASDYERLQKTTAELEETKAEFEELKENYTDTCVKLTNTTHALTDAKVRLMEFEERFQDKVAQVDDKYRAKLEELMMQNTELKRVFVQKCSELFDEKSQTDVKNEQKVQSARETMESLIKSKQRANVSIAVGGPLEKERDMKTRPLSAPGTRSETHNAHVTAGETMSARKHREFIPPEINMESNPESEELRAELLAVPVREISKAELLKSLF